MAYLDVDPDAAARSLPHGFSPAAPSVTVAPPAQDPVSVGVAGTLSARVDAITAYSGAARAITDIRSAMLRASANSYQHQEQVNTAGLGPDGLASAAQPSMPSAAIPPLPPATIPPPSLGAPPASARAISELIHSGPGPAGLYAAAQQMRRHASQLADTANQLHTRASALTQDWDSDAGREAAARITELGDWHDTHALHATAAAATLEQQADNYGRARTAIPTPERFDELQRRLHSAIAANQTPGSFGRYAPIISALHTEIGKLNSETMARYGDYTSGAANPSVVGDPLQVPPRPGGRDIQALDVPLAPPPQDPPHGKDPRYWLDVTKIIHVPEGQLAPYGTIQIGPGLRYPSPDSQFTYQAPPPAAKYPLDISDIVTTAPGQLGPNGHVLLTQTPQATYWAPDPGAGYQAAPPWPGPQQPIDVRDIIHVPEGSLAPYGTIQYLPGWFVYPRSNTPQLPQPR